MIAVIWELACDYPDCDVTLVLTGRSTLSAALREARVDHGWGGTSDKELCPTHRD